jgi:periplasmic protein TonB
MGYQALLFCPDEKTARTVTQVLSELDFAVVPCTEPFAAVKKLMGEHFDAIVVDCDNEQNATLLFKSAHNTVHNQSSLAVAVVEGQAGVAKAFRIGANLVLTKPINVEQAKGTLRVARGLLRKSEAAKPATGAASATVKPAAPVSEPAKPIVHPPVPISSARPAVTTIISTPKAPQQPQAVASAAASDEDDVDLFEVREEIPSPSMAAPVASISSTKVTAAAAATEPKTVEASSKPAPVAGFGASAASAPAPAREPQAAVSADQKPATSAETKNAVQEVGVSESSAAVASTAAQFTFGGNVDEGKAASGGGKKALAAVAALVLIAAGYGAWMKFGHASESAAIPPRVSSPPTSRPTSEQTTVPGAAPTKTSATSTPVSLPTPAAETASALKASPAVKSLPDTKTVTSNESATTHPSKSAETDLTKTSLEPTNKVAAKENAKPIVMKSSVSKVDAKTSPIADNAAPSLGAIAPAQNGALPNFIESQSKTPAPVLQTMSISQGVSQGLLVHKVQPPYPQNAMTMHIEGPVQLLATISKTGDITAVKILSGEPQLAHAAADAVKQWKYKPYLLNGSPVEIQTQVTINFKLPH